MKEVCSCCDSLIEEDQHFQLLEKQLLYELAVQAIRETSEAIGRKDNVCLRVIDHTSAGGLHAVRLCIDPVANTALITVPEEPDEADPTSKVTKQGIKGGRIPTVLHTIEILVAIHQFSPTENFPMLIFALPAEGCDAHDEDTHQCAEFKQVIPLMFDPPNTNALIFHTQASKVNPAELSLNWYEVMKMDPNLLEDPIRHTILLMPISPTDEKENEFYKHDQPEHKRQLFVEVLPESVVKNRSRFRAMHLSKIRRWETQDLSTRWPLSEIRKNGSRLIVNLG